MAKSVEAGAEGAAAATAAGRVRRARIRIAKAVRMSEEMETERTVGPGAQLVLESLRGKSGPDAWSRLGWVNLDELAKADGEEKVVVIAVEESRKDGAQAG
ncbi:hypothetical protein AnigIFM60653_004928 [Aspergillus niger]|nr:hypothetical protein AnigIFM60653_004928 [Aspergillus niger]